MYIVSGCDQRFLASRREIGNLPARLADRRSRRGLPLAHIARRWLIPGRRDGLIPHGAKALLTIGAGSHDPAERPTEPAGDGLRNLA